MKLVFQRESSKAPQTGKKSTNSKHHFEAQNTNANISNNKVSELFLNNNVSQLKKGLKSLNTLLRTQGKGWVGVWGAGGHAC